MNIKQLYKNISVLKLAGIKNFICVEITQNVARIVYIKRSEPIINIKAGEFLEKHFPILSETSFEYEGDCAELQKTVSEFIQKSKVDNPQIVICISDYQLKQLAVPHDTDDVDLWFIENIENILPNGYAKNDIVYNYEQTNEDENYKYFTVLLAESKLINGIVSAFSVSALNLVAIMPLPNTEGQGKYDSILSVIKKLTENIDTRLNLLDQESYEKQRTQIDKKISMNIILLAGLIVLILQLLAMSINYYTTSKNTSKQEAIFVANKQAKLNSELRQRNDKLKKDISILASLKTDRVKTSYLLYEISLALSQKSVLNSLFIKETDSREEYIELQGFAESQNEVAMIISRMEKSLWFKNTALLFAASGVGDDERTKNMIQFKISSKYNAYKK